MEQNLQLPVSIWKTMPTCCHRNKGEVEYIITIITNRATVASEQSTETNSILLVPVLCFSLVLVQVLNISSVN